MSSLSAAADLTFGIPRLTGSSLRVAIVRWVVAAVGDMYVLVFLCRRGVCWCVPAFDALAACAAVPLVMSCQSPSEVGEVNVVALEDVALVISGLPTSGCEVMTVVQPSGSDLRLWCCALFSVSRSGAFERALFVGDTSAKGFAATSLESRRSVSLARLAKDLVD